MPIIRSLRTRRAEREKATKLALAARTAAEEAERLRQFEEGSDKGSLSGSTPAVEYVNQSDDDDFKLDDSLEMTMSPDGVPILSRRPRTLSDRLRHLLTLTFSVVAIVDAFVFLFVVPFVVAPCVSVILARFNDTPVVCAVSSVERLTGMSNCTEWTSCKTGCTPPALNCTRVTVNYKPAETDEEESAAEQGRILSEGQLRSWRWIQRDARLFVNNEGCGYLPTVNCSAFDEFYDVLGKAFWCHNSEREPERVIPEFSSAENLFTLVVSSAGPAGLFFVSLVIVMCLNCRCCCGKAPVGESQHDEDQDGGDDTGSGGGGGGGGVRGKAKGGRTSKDTFASGDLGDDSVLTTPIHSVSARVDGVAGATAAPGLPGSSSAHGIHGRTAAGKHGAAHRNGGPGGGGRDGAAASSSSGPNRGGVTAAAAAAPSKPPPYDFPPLYDHAQQQQQGGGGSGHKRAQSRRKESSMASSTVSSAGTRIEVRSPPGGSGGGDDDDDVETKTPPPPFKLPLIIAVQDGTAAGAAAGGDASSATNPSSQ